MSSIFWAISFTVQFQCVQKVDLNIVDIEVWIKTMYVKEYTMEKI